MESHFSEKDLARALQTLESIDETIDLLIDWNKNAKSAEDYYSSPQGMQLLAANCTLITAIGEGINRINRILPDFLKKTIQIYHGEELSACATISATDISKLTLTSCTKQ